MKTREKEGVKLEVDLDIKIDLNLLTGEVSFYFIKFGTYGGIQPLSEIIENELFFIDSEKEIYKRYSDKKEYNLDEIKKTISLLNKFVEGVEALDD